MLLAVLIAVGESLKREEERVRQSLLEAVAEECVCTRKPCPSHACGSELGREKVRCTYKWQWQGDHYPVFELWLEERLGQSVDDGEVPGLSYHVTALEPSGECILHTRPLATPTPHSGPSTHLYEIEEDI